MDKVLCIAKENTRKKDFTQIDKKINKQCTYFNLNNKITNQKGMHCNTAMRKEYGL